MKNDIKSLIKDLNKFGNPKKARDFSWFFKTGPGEYGEGDLFVGISVPECRSLAKKYKELSLLDIQKLIKSKYHEHRLTALLILVQKYQSIKKTKPFFCARYDRNKSEEKRGCGFLFKKYKIY